MAPPVQDTNVPLEADEFDDRDSVYGAGSDTTSVLSSIHNYRVANGRTYHSYNSDCKTTKLADIISVATGEPTNIRLCSNHLCFAK